MGDVIDLALARERLLEARRLERGPELAVIFVNGERRGAEPGRISRARVIELAGWAAGEFEGDYYVAQLALGSYEYEEIRLGEDGFVLPLKHFFVGPR